MKQRSSPVGNEDEILRVAAEWTLRQDRGLDAVEQDEFSQWLSASPRNRQVWSECHCGWSEFDRLAGLQSSLHPIPDPNLLAPRRRQVHRFALPALVAIAAILLLAVLGRTTEKSLLPAPSSPGVSHGAQPLALIEQRRLDDGTLVQLNRGAVLTEHYTRDERRVCLERGEAYFSVTKDPSRPFIVEASGVAVRAVGTAFNVKLHSSSVEVLVSEGKVGVSRTALGSENLATSSGAKELPLHLVVGERTVVSLSAPSVMPRIISVAPTEMEARLSWQPRMLDFSDAPLAAIVAEFNKRNPIKLIVPDPNLAMRRMSAAFRSDNVEGFVRLMQSDFGIAVERREGREIVLRASGAEIQ